MEEALSDGDLVVVRTARGEGQFICRAGEVDFTEMTPAEIRGIVLLRPADEGGKP